MANTYTLDKTNKKTLESEIALLQSKLTLVLDIGAHESKLLKKKTDALMNNESLRESPEARGVTFNELGQKQLKRLESIKREVDSITTGFENLNKIIDNLKGGELEQKLKGELEMKLKSLRIGVDGLVNVWVKELANEEQLTMDICKMVNQRACDLWGELLKELDATRKLTMSRITFKFDQAEATLASIFSMLKSINEEEYGGPYKVEVEAFKIGFKTIEEDMKKKVECLEQSLAESEKRNRSSYFYAATLSTLVAAFAVYTYFPRRHVGKGS